MLSSNASPIASPRHQASVLGVPIDVLTARQAVERIAAWARAGQSRVVVACNAHSVVTAARDPSFMAALRRADLALPDGAPVAWMVGRQGEVRQARIAGPDLMHDYCALAASRGEAIFLLGSTPATLTQLQTRLCAQWPGLRIAGAISPPFRAMTTAEDASLVNALNASGAGTVWVGLGCPKQELWMDAHRDHVAAVMVGVGAAFDFHAGTLSRAPNWMRRNGLEWLHRLIHEPRRLSGRYLRSNSAFIALAIAQCWQLRRPRQQAQPASAATANADAAANADTTVATKD